MKIYFAGDHAGFQLKSALIEQFSTTPYEVVDLGPRELAPEDDYPDYVTPLAEAVANDAGGMGVICAGSGQGEAMCANRVKGVRAIVFYGKLPAVGALDVEGGRSQDGFDIIRLSRRHNNASVLSIGARFVTPEDAEEAVRVFLETPFDPTSPRHARRLAKF